MLTFGRFLDSESFANRIMSFGFYFTGKKCLQLNATIKFIMQNPQISTIFFRVDLFSSLFNDEID